MNATSGRLDPIGAARLIRDSYLRYLKSRYAPADDRLRDELHDALDHRFRIDRGPFMQASPAYEKGCSIDGLIAEGVLHPRMREVPPSAFPTQRPLHSHQETAIRKVRSDRNLVIATGTGSGKTECYLLPVLDHLLRECDVGTIGEPGVRALLLYPMNALANDQMKRIRDLLRPFPEITYGRFTGGTPEHRRQGEEEHRAAAGTDPDPGELVSRQQMREAPPHVLLTNYAMLEYLLLRPVDTAFFDGPTGAHWRFVVLDEMHIYNGARGAEIAMLLRRVRDRVNRSEPGRLQFIGTSATLGHGEQAAPRIAKYAADLFGERVKHHSHDQQRQDIITPIFADQPETSTWEAPDGSWAAIEKALADDRWPAGLQLPLPPQTAASLCSDGEVRDAAALLDALRSEEHIVRLRDRLRRGPVDAAEVARAVFDGPPSAEEISALLNVCTNSYGSASPLIPARFHYLVRALEGAFMCVSPMHPAGTSRLHLERHKTCPGCADRGRDSLVFELGVCDRCGASYLLGSEDADADARVIVKQALPQERRLLYLLLDDQAEHDDEDEAAIVDDETVQATIDRRVLCTACGCLSEEGQLPCPCHGDPRTRTVTATVVKPARAGQPLRRCPACSRRTNSDIVLRFFTGQDAPVSVVATALYQSLPAVPPAASNLLAPEVGEGRKLLSFADSRSDAAFFAPYLDRTYSRAVHRRLVWEALSSNAENDVRFDDLVPRIRRLAEDCLVIDPDDSSASKSAQVRLWLMADVLATDRRQSLDGVGLAEITVAVPRGVSSPPGLASLGFTDSEALDLALVLIDTLRSQAAVHLPDDVDIEDQTFAPRNVVTAVRTDRPDRAVIAWRPARGSNRRSDYLRRLFARRGLSADPAEVLNGLWDWLTRRGSPWRRVLRETSKRRQGTVFAIDYERITMIPASAFHPSYECSKCNQVSWRSVSQVCPSYLCDGELRPASAEGSPSTAHYRHLYTRLEPSGMRVEEHTGQLATDRARELQQEFLDGKVNTLSCTTTFELGVDVGDVVAVLMRNVPPSPANYVQRAGRAGRRALTPALVVTFAQRRSHDLHHFREPMRLIEGHVDVPILSMQNPLIARRHIHAVAFASYERKHVDEGGTAHNDVASFFTAQGDQPAAVDDFEAWLRRRPEELGEAISRITPADLRDELEVETWGWVTALVDDQTGRNSGANFGWLARATNEIRGDLNDIDSEVEAAAQRVHDLRQQNQSDAAARQTRRQNALLKVRHTLERRRLINYLATRVVLPKYGFPVDVVTMDVWRSGDRGADGLNLDRDLRMAITDYAPGTQLPADKALWESTGLRVQPGRSLLSYLYGACEDCGTFRTSLITDDGDGDPGPCDGCGSNTLSESHRLVVPLFGFVGRRSNVKPGETKPPKSGWSQFHFSDYAGEPPERQRISVGRSDMDARFSRQGRITVVNSGPAGAGFRVCLSCGHTEAAANSSRPIASEHSRPGIQQQCSGILSHRHLGHQYFTDVVELGLRFQITEVQARSFLYALLAAMPVAGIPASDIDGTIRPGIEPSLVVFDTVPGGAGHVRRVRESLPRLVREARRVAQDCDCAVTTSCYGCLRTYTNQRFHDELVRGDALRVLDELLGTP